MYILYIYMYKIYIHIYTYKEIEVYKKYNKNRLKIIKLRNKPYIKRSIKRYIKSLN